MSLGTTYPETEWEENTCFAPVALEPSDPSSWKPQGQDVVLPSL